MEALPPPTMLYTNTFYTNIILLSREIGILISMGSLGEWIYGTSTTSTYGLCAPVSDRLLE